MITSESKDDELLFQQLHRMNSTIGLSSATDDRRRLLALEGDLKALRSKLVERSAWLSHRMNTSNSQIKAISAYARGATLGRSRSKFNVHTQNDGVTK
jgi:hypothetical protein